MKMMRPLTLFNFYRLINDCSYMEHTAAELLLFDLLMKDTMSI